MATHGGPRESAAGPHDASSAPCAKELREDSSEHSGDPAERHNDGSESPKGSTDPQKSRTGYIIDFDCAAIKEHERSGTAFLTVGSCYPQSRHYSN